MNIIQNPTLERLQKFENVSWPEELQASRKELLGRLLDFPQGVFMLKDRTDVCQITVAPKEIPKVTGFEQMRDLPVDLNSRDLWVINIATRKDKRGEGYASKLIDQVIEWARENAYRSIQTGVTCHGYREKLDNDEIGSIEEYMETKLNPALKLFPGAEWKLIPSYWPEDEGSGGYGVLVKIKL